MTETHVLVLVVALPVVALVVLRIVYLRLNRQQRKTIADVALGAVATLVAAGGTIGSIVARQRGEREWLVGLVISLGIGILYFGPRVWGRLSGQYRGVAKYVASILGSLIAILYGIWHVVDIPWFLTKCTTLAYAQ
jgi:hypothetical protein